jgi:zinc and cadmium transporter
MATALMTILLSVLAVSLISFVGIFTLLLKREFNTFLSYLVSFAAGGMLGAAFLDLLPEAMEKLAGSSWILLGTLAGIVVFFTIEMVLHWHHQHAHRHEEMIHPVGYLNIMGDGLHNFIDGVIIASAYLISFPLGLITTIAVIMHEIPQEFGDFGILVYSGFSKSGALFINFMTALTAFAGAIFAFYFSGFVTNFSTLILPFAAGNFIYIAVADLMPEIHRHTEKKILQSILNLLLLLAGVALIYVMSFFFNV